MLDRQPVALEPANQRRRRGGTADHHAHAAAQLPALRLLVQRLLDRHPHGRHAKRKRCLFVLHDLEQVLNAHVLAGHGQVAADHGRGERNAPRINVEHGRDHEHGVVAGKIEAIGQRYGQRMQHHRAVRMHNALRTPDGAGGVAHAARGILVQRRIAIVGSIAGDERLVILIRRGYRGAGGRDHDDAIDVDQRQHLFEQGQQDVVNENNTVARVLDDVGDVLRRQAEVERVQNRPGGRDAEIGLHVPGTVPHQGADRLAGLHTGIDQRFGQPPRPVIHRGPGRAGYRFVGEARDDLMIAEELPAALKQMVHAERNLHHRGTHARSPLPQLSRFAPDDTNGALRRFLRFFVKLS